MFRFRTPLLLASATFAAGLSLSSCETKPAAATEQPVSTPAADTTAAASASTTQAPDPSSIPASNIANAAAITARPQVPILCYHQIRDWRAKDSKAAKDYIVPVAEFKKQIKMLADSGYHTILPDQLYAYLTTGAKLPSKPVMLTFDDTDLDQFTIAKPEMDKHGFKGVFFVMTVSLGRPNYMTKAMVKQLSDEGHVIGSHTWDHHNVKKYQGQDWVTQIEKPTKTLEEITGKDIKYFAFPFGLWNTQAIPELKKRGMVAAFVLAEKRDQQDPLFTIRRIIASGYWSPRTLHNSMVNSF
ncbi:polysaccharide deacetylase [Hymenobacter sp. DG25B]|jgi:peptidoglycan/xylan/chitin deacetylase (PgdA/CDA1 family)|uniref:polysaccharide deacetylase family protein n=1 Tax=Hymenobacter sp. DG25B TaxID=1385664 RepID=UPI00054133E3|nr:polysaccharide deacetylase family protein [Hymenobacter sp. DG25B]AIZ63865.1 polysaccharide deacetylase [Hymenobacter sp. DG25B]